MHNTPNFNLPLLFPSQMQKEVTVNESLFIIDALLSRVAISKKCQKPPSNPKQGQVYIIEINPQEEWLNHAKQIAIFANGWQYIVPQDGYQIWIQDEGKSYIYLNQKWSAHI